MMTFTPSTKRKLRDMLGGIVNGRMAPKSWEKRVRKGKRMRHSTKKRVNKKKK
jgi:hypothetical protein